MPQNRLFELNLDVLSKAYRVIVAGDIHGDYEGFRRICDIFDPEQDYLIFLGDYADRGPRGIEVLDGVVKLVREYPSRVIALKGNHEDYTEDGRPKFMPCDLMYEAGEKKGGWGIYFKDVLKPLIDKLYLAALVLDEVLFVHGGISSKVKGINDLRHPNRFVEEDVLWSDPFEGYGEHPNVRGAGVKFGKDVSREVCSGLGVKRIVRSHEPRKAGEGPYTEHDGRVITVSSTIVYGGTPFILVLPTIDLDESFKKLERHAMRLR